MNRKARIVLILALLLISTICAIYLNNSSKSAFLEKVDEDKKPIFSVDTDEKVVALTFDINWSEKEHLEEILEVLNKYDIKATFFIMGKWVIYPEGNKEKLEKIKEGGHEIGNHSYVHPDFTKITKGRILEELRKTDEIIKEISGYNPKLFRFPSGAYNEESYSMIKSLGYECIQWNIDSIDWKESGEEIEYQRVMKNIAPGSIVLFHNNAKYTPKNLEKIILDLKKQEYSILPIGEMMHKDSYIIDSQGIQRKK